MAHLPQVWQRLRTYVIYWLEANQNSPIDKVTTTSIKNETNLTGAVPSKNIAVKRQDESLELSESNLNELLVAQNQIII
jgi:hypothetical protein